MSNILSIAADTVAKYVKDTVKLRSLKRSDVETLIENNIKDHQRIVDILSMMNDIEINTWMRDRVKPNLKKNNTKLKNEYDNYFSELSGKALAAERGRPLGAILASNAKYIDILKEIKKNIDKLIETESMTIFECRMSHVAVLGLLRQSYMVLNYSVYLYTFLVKIGSGNAGMIPRYREEYILNNHNQVVKCINNILNKDANYSFLREVDTLRKRNADLVLGATGKFEFHNISVISNYSISFLDNILTFLSCLNIFGAALDLYDDWMLDRHQRNKEMKEWLENHVSLMRMDMANMDKSSPEYTKTLEIIAVYEQEITDLDEKITKFENS